MPELQDLQMMRKGFDHNKSMYDIQNRAPLMLYGVFLPCVGSVKEFHKKFHHQKLSDIYSVSQEGYVLLELSNNYTVWMTDALWKFKHPDEIAREEPPEYHVPSASTSTVGDNTTIKTSGRGASRRGARGTKWTHSRYYTTMDGWSEEGMKNYNEFCSGVKKDRREPNGILFEDKFLQQMQKDKNIGHSKRQEEDNFVQPYNDLWGDTENDDQATASNNFDNNNNNNNTDDVTEINGDDNDGDGCGDDHGDDLGDNDDDSTVDDEDDDNVEGYTGKAV